MIYSYKGYDYENKTWIYGEKEILVNTTDFSKRYFIVNNEGKYEFNECDICKITPLKSGKQMKPIYDKDIISIKFENNEEVWFIVKIGEGKLKLNSENIIIYGLTLQGFNGESYIFNDNVINNPECISIIGNTLEK